MSIRCEAIFKSYKNLAVLENINLEVKAGEFVCLLGPSGCGKSSFLRILAGIDEASSGRFFLPESSAPQQAKTAMVFQDASLFPWMTVLENVRFGLQNLGLSKREEIKQAQDLLEMMKLKGFENAYPQRLSGGMRQRVGIARAFASNADVLLMDEPFGSLDAQTRLMMQSELLNLWWEARKTILYVTHDIDEALLLADRIYVFSPRPAKIKAVIPVKLNRPRSLHDVDKAEIREIRWNIWNLLADSQADSK